MNALWVSRMSAYAHSPYAIGTARAIIAHKVARQSALLERYGRGPIVLPAVGGETVTDLLLEEARATRRYWSEFRALVPGRKDTVNYLLDIGYHQVTNIIRRFLETRDVSPALGLFHPARFSRSAPLAYDLVELFRATRLMQRCCAL